MDNNDVQNEQQNLPIAGLARNQTFENMYINAYPDPLLLGNGPQQDFLDTALEFYSEEGA